MTAPTSTILQDTVAEMAKNMKSNKTGATQASASELYDFMKRVCGQHPCYPDQPIVSPLYPEHLLSQTSSGILRIIGDTACV